MEKTQVVLVGLYTYFNVPVRILHPLVDRLEGVEAHTIFYKNYDTNIFGIPTAIEEEIFVDIKINLYCCCITRKSIKKPDYHSKYGNKHH